LLFLRGRAIGIEGQNEVFIQTLKIVLFSMAVAFAPTPQLYSQSASRVVITEIQTPGAQQTYHLIETETGAWTMKIDAQRQFIFVDRLHTEADLKNVLNVRRFYVPSVEVSQEIAGSSLPLSQIEQVTDQAFFADGGGKAYAYLHETFVSNALMNKDLAWRKSSQRIFAPPQFLFATDIGAIFLTAYPAAVFTIQNYPAFGSALGMGIIAGGGAVLLDNIRESLPPSLDRKRGAPFAFNRPGPWGTTRRIFRSAAVMSGSMGCAVLLKLAGVI
jgi:hypothetical protein